MIPVLFLLISMIPFSNVELQHQTKFLKMEMIHRDDHPTLAAKNVNLSRSQIMKKRLERDQMRVTSLSNRVAQHPSSTANTPTIPGNFIFNNSGEYFTRLGIGTPAKDLYMILDTGSDLTWLQCQPCTNCYNQADHIFVPKDSTTYKELPCWSEPCMLLGHLTRPCESEICQYKESYVDGSFTFGNLANETLTLSNNISVAGIALGCGHDNKGSFVPAAGILGLGGGNLSFPSQLADQQFQFRRQFSYCLVSQGSSNKSIITFGQTPLPSETRFTPMLTNMDYDTFYYVNLTGISVGGSKIQGVNSSISEVPLDGLGGVIIDSGTVITRLERSAYMAVRDAFREAMGNLMQTLPPVELLDFLETCYNLSGPLFVSVPTVVLHFADGADMQLQPNSCLVPVDSDGTFCFAFAPSNDGMSIIGNVQQQGFEIMFDLENKMIGITGEVLK